eukprot:gene18489-24202_t
MSLTDVKSPRVITKPHYQIKEDYDYSKSTEENYSIDPIHAKFVEERQLFHDELIDLFANTIINDGNTLCDRPAENWIVFTAGPMGAGKSFTIEWLYNKGLFPLKAFVRVDPDAIRDLLPETAEYNKINHDLTGKLTQKEVGYISEVLILDALDQGKNVLVDGSLRDYVWYRQYILKLRSLYPNVKICILHVTASEDTVIRRAVQRAGKTGRYIPLDVMLSTINQINKSMEILAPLTNFVVSLSNEEGFKEPELLFASERVISNSEVLSSCSDDSMDSVNSLSSPPISHVCSYSSMTGLKTPQKTISLSNSFSMLSDQISSHKTHSTSLDSYATSNNHIHISPSSDWQSVFRNVWEMKCKLPDNNRLSRKYKQSDFEL